MAIVRRRSIAYLLFTALLPLLAVLMVSCSYQGQEVSATSEELTLTPVYKSRVLQADQQTPELSITTNSEGTAILWSGVSIKRPGAVGIAGVDTDGILSYRRVLFPEEKSEQGGETAAEDEGGAARPAAVNVIDSNTAVIALSQSKVSSGSKVRLDLSLHAIKDGVFFKKPFVLEDAGISEAKHIYFVNDDDGRFSLVWESSGRVKRQSFEIGEAKGGAGQIVKKLSAAATVVKREHLAAVDLDGNLYFLTLRSSGRGKLDIFVTKTDKEGEVIFDDLLVAKGAQFGSGQINQPHLVAGASSLALIWGDTNLQQVSASGELLGEAAKLKKAGPRGMRIMKTHGETIIDDIYASTRRQLRPLLSSRELTTSELEKLMKKDEPLFAEIGDEQNKGVLEAVSSFMERALETSHGAKLSYSFNDARGNQINANMSQVASDMVTIQLEDPKPMIMIDFYRGGRLLKTINLGRGEDAALVADDHDLIASWTGGDGFVDLRIARWLLKARRN